MPPDKSSNYHYTKYMLDLFKDDIIKMLGPQHEGCYRVDIVKRKIEELAALFHKQIDTDKSNNG